MRSLGAKPDGLRQERIEASPLWHEGAFRNVHPVLPRLLRSDVPMPTIREFIFAGGRRVPVGPLPAVDPRAGWASKPQSGLRTTWLGHSTVLIEIDGVNVLTDPVWGSRASPSQWAGPKRFQPVPIPIRALPELDAVVISHDHYDHLDYTSIRALAKRDVPFITSLGVGAHLEAWGVPAHRIVELDWWESYSLPKVDLTVTAAPSQHFSGRGLRGRNGTLWSSLVVRSQRHSVFFSGDTGLTTEYAEILRRLGPFDLVMLEVGAYHPAWGHIHLGPENALEAWSLLGKSAFLPVHWGTFSLAMHDWDEPAETLLAQGTKLGVPLVMPHLGEPVEPKHVEQVSPWWRKWNDNRSARLSSKRDRRSGNRTTTRSRRACRGRLIDQVAGDTPMPMLKVATFNVNGIRARLAHLLNWLEREQPDIACLQELKAPSAGFPILDIRAAGYDAIWHGQSSWNGVAVLVKGAAPKERRHVLPGDPTDEHSRYIEADVGELVVGCLYLPNGNPQPGPKFDYKLRWFERLIEHAKELHSCGRPVILAGDYNVVPTDFDIYNPRSWLKDALLQPESRDCYQRLLAQGWTDALRAIHPAERVYTFWDYFRQSWQRNAGLRIDHLLLNAEATAWLLDAGVDRWVRDLEKPSDHAPTWVTLSGAVTPGPAARKRTAGSAAGPVSGRPKTTKRIRK